MPSFSNLYTVYVITHYSLIKHSHMTVDAELWLGRPGKVGAPRGYTGGARWPQSPVLLTTCRYTVHKTPYPRSVVRLTGNTFLLTNVTTLRLRCLTQDAVHNVGILLSHVQTVHTFDCHCETINADEFRIVAELRYCENATELTTVVDI